MAGRRLPAYNPRISWPSPARMGRQVLQAGREYYVVAQLVINAHSSTSRPLPAPSPVRQRSRSPPRTATRCRVVVRGQCRF
ncbi:MAG: hypothetical protein R2731_02595 [Nocardioides sp.]